VFCYCVIKSDKPVSCHTNISSNIFIYFTIINEMQRRQTKSVLYSVSKEGLKGLEKSIVFLLVPPLEILALCTQLFLEDAKVSWRAG